MAVDPLLGVVCWLFQKLAGYRETEEEEIVKAYSMLEQTSMFEVDPVEEMRMRTWARRHYAPVQDRDEHWHPVVLDEMVRRDRERGFAHSPK